MAKRKWLKKYMSFEHLEGTLKRAELHMGDPKSWCDKNDAAVVEKYRLHKTATEIRVTWQISSASRPSPEQKVIRVTCSEIDPKQPSVISSVGLWKSRVVASNDDLQLITEIPGHVLILNSGSVIFGQCKTCS